VCAAKRRNVCGLHTPVKSVLTPPPRFSNLRHGKEIFRREIFRPPRHPRGLLRRQSGTACQAARRPAETNAEGRRQNDETGVFANSSFFILNSPVTGSFYYHCDWHASHYVKVMLDQIFGGKNLRKLL
jgi:hypothetical protein